MHIAFLCSEYPPLPCGGIGINIQNLARTLVRRGHKVTVISWGQPMAFEDEGVQVRFLSRTRIPKMGWFLNRRIAQRELNRLVADEELDIVEAQDWCGISAGLKLKVPLVIRCHGSAVYFAYLLQEKVRPSVWWAEWLALRQAGSIMAVSQFTAEVTSHLFRLSKPIGVILNGIDVQKFQPSQSDEVEPNTILYLGTVVRKKGVLDLCRAFSAVVAEHPNARLIVVGRDVPDKRTASPSTWGLCQELLSPAARERTLYMGLQPHDKVQEYLHRTAVCVFPSYAEALPLSWLEAMACAKPIVAYDIGWAPEVIESGVQGILVPLGDIHALAQAILTLLSDPKRGVKMGAAARQRVEDYFSVNRVAEETVQWYQQVLRGAVGW